jgi:hypothetical protein
MFFLAHDKVHRPLSISIVQRREHHCNSKLRAEDEIACKYGPIPTYENSSRGPSFLDAKNLASTLLNFGPHGIALFVRVQTTYVPI